MFHHDIDQSVLIVTLLLAAMFALPFVMAWLEKSLHHDTSAPSPDEPARGITALLARVRQARGGR